MLELLAGIGLGLILSAPVGPMGVLAMLKKLEGNTRYALGIAAGACVADGIMAWVATLPIDVIPTLPINERVASFFLAVLFFALAGWVWQTAQDPLSTTDATADRVLHARSKLVHGFVVGLLWVRDRLEDWGAMKLVAFGTGLGATALHPGNVLAFLLSFGWLKTQGIRLEGPVSQTLLIAGIMLGAFAMWVAMLEAATVLGHWLAAGRIMPLLRRGVALCVAAGGAVAVYHAFA